MTSRASCCGAATDARLTTGFDFEVDFADVFLLDALFVAGLGFTVCVVFFLVAVVVVAVFLEAVFFAADLLAVALPPVPAVFDFVVDCTRPVSYTHLTLPTICSV